MEKILNLGCGTDKIKDAVNVDMNPGVNPDIVFELQRGLCLPFVDNFFDRIYMLDFIEHVDDASWALSEAHRVGKSGTQIHIRYPHFTSNNNYGDVSHVRRINLRALEHFDPSKEYGQVYRSYNKFFRNFPVEVVSANPIFPDSKLKFLSEALYNSLGKDRYEFYIAKFLPIENVDCLLKIIK